MLILLNYAASGFHSGFHNDLYIAISKISLTTNHAKEAQSHTAAGKVHKEKVSLLDHFETFV